MKKCQTHLEKDGLALFLREGLQLLVGIKRWIRLEWGLAFFFGHQWMYGIERSFSSAGTSPSVILLLAGTGEENSTLACAARVAYSWVAKRCSASFSYFVPGLP